MDTQLNCHAQPRCVKCLVPHWTKDRIGSKKQETNLFARKTKNVQKDKILDASQFLLLNQARYVHTSKGVGVKPSTKAAGGDEFHPAPPFKINPWKKLPPRIASQQQFKAEVPKLFCFIDRFQNFAGSGGPPVATSLPISKSQKKEMKIRS
ncbi:hypothetical protein EVAR_38544_1 [Eumeta japonica]|uniref:Uncharacterized protein n=1 Tax=Eumeta variegata TaxID=151549 RepID=A0A4C1WDL8_EUMVA|nr:hypothetical protein EVAR_38544_1 [Eumeta japonica]